MMKKGISASFLKLTAMITMLIDHIGAVIIIELVRTASGREREIGNCIYWTVRGIGRIAFPLFIFLLIEGFFHTRSRFRYFLRLFLFGFISEIPFDMAFNIKAAGFSLSRFPEFSSQNVMFTLAIGFFCIWAMEELYLKDIPQEGDIPQDGLRGVSLTAVGACVLIALSGCYLGHYFSVDYGWGGVLAIILAYLFRKYKGRKAGFLAQMLTLSIYNNFECVAFVDYFLIDRYNGERGRVRLKWFFYIFYPAHLLLLGTVRWILFR